MKYLKGFNIKTNGFEISRIGLGGSALSTEPKTLNDNIDTVHAALDSGITYLNTADFYGHGQSEMLLRDALRTRKREDVFISVKFGAMAGPDGMYGIDVRPHVIKNYLNYTLKRLGTDYVDLYQPSRIDPNIPVEETIGAIADMVKSGYVKNVGISEIDGDTLRKANATHPISLVEVQYSLLNRSIETDILPAARELGIGVVAFGVLFNGLLGGRNPQEKLSNLAKRMPPSAVDILSNKLTRMDALKSMADAKGITVAQLAIAWVLSQGEDIMTIVGARTPAQLSDILKAITIELNADDKLKIEQIFPATETASSYMLPLNLDKNGLFKH